MYVWNSLQSSRYLRLASVRAAAVIGKGIGGVGPGLGGLMNMMSFDAKLYSAAVTTRARWPRAEAPRNDGMDIALAFSSSWRTSRMSRLGRCFGKAVRTGCGNRLEMSIVMVARSGVRIMKNC